MTAKREKDWDPGTYARFRGLRLRPALDLLAQVPDLPEGDVIDLGCGAGVVAEPLRQRFPGRGLVGVDASPAMLDQARATGCYGALVEADAGQWQPETPPALIFSNALLQWLPDHDRLFPCLADLLAPGGTLAVQMPRQTDAPSHRLIREVSARLFPDRFDWTHWVPPVDPPEVYARRLRGKGHLNLWETEYLQPLARQVAGHPVRQFTQSTAMRPVSTRLSEEELARFLTVYDAELQDAYPSEPDGTVLFPFRRVFMVLTS